MPYNRLGEHRAEPTRTSTKYADLFGISTVNSHVLPSVPVEICGRETVYMGPRAGFKRRAGRRRELCALIIEENRHARSFVVSEDEIAIAVSVEVCRVNFRRLPAGGERRAGGRAKPPAADPEKDRDCAAGGVCHGHVESAGVVKVAGRDGPGPGADVIANDGLSSLLWLDGLASPRDGDCIKNDCYSHPPSHYVALPVMDESQVFNR
jgi:hypothetical protein